MNSLKLLGAATVALAGAALPSTPAQPRGDCVQATLATPLLLPDGSRFEGTNLKICVDRRLTPVSVLHSIYVDGLPIGFFVSRDRHSEESDGPPRIGFTRSADGTLRLVAYTSPNGSRARMFRFPPAPEALDGNEVASLHDEARLREEPVWIAARRH